MRALTVLSLLQCCFGMRLLSGHWTMPTDAMSPHLRYLAALPPGNGYAINWGLEIQNATEPSNVRHGEVGVEIRGMQNGSSTHRVHLSLPYDAVSQNTTLPANCKPYLAQDSKIVRCDLEIQAPRWEYGAGASVYFDRFIWVPTLNVSVVVENIGTTHHLGDLTLVSGANIHPRGNVSVSYIGKPPSDCQFPRTHLYLNTWPAWNEEMGVGTLDEKDLRQACPNEKECNMEILDSSNSFHPYSMFEIDAGVEYRNRTKCPLHHHGWCVGQSS